MIQPAKLEKCAELALALYNPFSNLRCQHFSFIYYKNKIMVIGKNNDKTHPVNLLNPRISRTGQDVSHMKASCSELTAVLKLKRMTNIAANKCSLVNVRVNNNRQLSLARPCNSCSSLVQYFGFKDVIFTNSAGKFEYY